MKKLLLLISVFVLAILLFFVINNKNQTEVKIYFYNPSIDQGPGGAECSGKGLVGVKRKAPYDPKSAINLLLSGSISEDDKKSGLTTEFPLKGLRLESLVVTQDTATLVLSDPNNQTSGGSCRISILRAQIEETLKQFSSIKKVKILPDYLFQP